MNACQKLPPNYFMTQQLYTSYTLLQNATQAICHSTHEGEQTVCLNQFQVPRATTPTTYCRCNVSLLPVLDCMFITFSSLSEIL